MQTSKRIRLYGVLLLVALVLMGLLYQLARPSGEPRIRLPRGYLEVATEGKLRMLTSYDAFVRDSLAGGQQGIYALARQIGQRAGLEVEVLLEDNDDTAMELLRSGRIDVIAKPMVRTASIDSTELVWVQDMTTGPVYLVQRRDSLTYLDKQLDLAGRTIYLPKASPLRIFIDHLSEEIGDSIHIIEDPLYNTEQIIMRVAARSIDYTLCSDAEAQHYRQLFDSLDFDLPVSYSLRRGWLMRRSSPDLVDSLRAWLTPR